MLRWASLARSRRRVITSVTSASASRARRTADFLDAGLERDAVCVLLGHDAARARVLAGLERRGLAPDEFRRRDRLHAVSGRQPSDALLREIECQRAAICRRA
jgi:hypothetical protein